MKKNNQKKSDSIKDKEKTDSLKKGKKKKSGFNREILTSTYIFTGLFVLLMGYFVYFMVFQSENVINNPYNKRQDLFTKRVIRGTIYDRSRNELAYTDIDEEGNETRIYPYDNMFAHVVGYSDTGQTGIESGCNFYLLRSNTFFAQKIYNDIAGNKSMGDSIVTTLDADLQKTAYNALGTNRGAVVVTNPSTGEILAMVSKPDYNPNTIHELLTQLEEDTNTENDSVLYNRATQGLYPPGSTFKFITLLEYLEEGNAPENFSYKCSGSITEGSDKIRCYKGTAHGSEDLTKAFAKSCNSAFAKISLSLNLSSFRTTCNNLLFNTELPVPMEYNKSSFSLDTAASNSLIMQTGIGQGETLVSPMHMNLLMSAIANEGTLMKPYYLAKVENYQGDVQKEFSPTVYKPLFTKEQTGTLKPYLRAVVTDGTGHELNVDNYTAYGKTGSAEFGSEKGKSHAWFVGFAEKESKKLVVSILVEEGGSGSETAVPIAKALFDDYFSQ